MYFKWLRRSPCYVVKCALLLQLISRTIGAGCSVNHDNGMMNYPTTTASGTWTTRGGISSYGWDSRQPIDPCSRCTNVPPPLPGSHYTTQIHDNGHSANDRISTVSGYVSDNRPVSTGYGSDNRPASTGYGSDNRPINGGYVSDNRPISVGYISDNRHTDGYGSDNNRGNSYTSDNRVGVYNTNVNNRPNDYNSNGHIGNGAGYISGNNYGGNHPGSQSGYNVNNQIRNPDYRGNGYDNLSPEWDRRHNNKKGSGMTGGGGLSGSFGGGGGGGYYQGTSYPVSNIADGQGAHAQGNYHRPSNDRWGIKGAYPVKVEPGYWQSQPPMDIGWDEDSKRVGVIAGWIGGSKKYESGKPSQAYNSHQVNDKDDDYFNKGTGYDNSDRKKPMMGWGGSGSYEVVKMSHGYKYIDRNSNSDYGTTYGNNYGYGGQSYNYNSRPSQDYGSKPINFEHSKPNGHETLNYDKPTHDYGQGYNKPTQDNGRPSGQGYNRPTHDFDRPSSNDYGSRPNVGWSTSRPIGFEITSSRPPTWGSQKPGYSAIASRPTQHWGENSFSELSGNGGLTGYDRPGGNDVMRPDGGYSFLRPDGGYGSSRPDGNYGSLRPDGNYGSSRPVDGYSSSRPVDGYSSSRPVDGYSSSRPVDGYSSSRPDGGYSSSRPDDYGLSRPSNGGSGGGERPDYGTVRPYVGSMLHNTIMVSDYGSQRPDFNKFGGYSDNGGGRPQMNNRPGYYNERPFMNGNDVYGSQQQMGSGYGKGYASNWDYSNSMRGSSSASSGGWNDHNRDYLQRRPDGDVLQSGSNHRPSESTPLHYNGHSGIGASTDNGFLYRNPSTISSSTTPMPTTDSA